MLIADYSLKELAHLPKHIKAENGGAGKGEDCTGRNGSDCVYEVRFSIVARTVSSNFALFWIGQSIFVIPSPKISPLHRQRYQFKVTYNIGFQNNRKMRQLVQ